LNGWNFHWFKMFKVFDSFKLFHSPKEARSSAS